jgi:AcrR family transcriptional regulator
MDESRSRPRLWDRTRQQALAELSETAVDLFLEQGFEQTTIDEIIAAAGISRRSFFRYFGTKEDVVLGHLAGEGAVVRAELERRAPSEDIWTALTESLSAVEHRSADRERPLALARMIYGSPTLRAASVHKHLGWRTDLVPEVERRLDGDERELRANAVVAAFIGCLDVAGEQWAHDGDVRPLREYLAVAVGAVRGHGGVGTVEA